MGLSCDLLGLAFGFQLGVAKGLARDLLDLAFDLFRRPLYPIFVRFSFS